MINASRKRNQGITLVEVLTSIIVAVIGVAGVLVLIPFGIRQAQVGLDLDDSTSLAENALAQFEIEGHGRVVSAVGMFGGDAMPWVRTDNSLVPLTTPTAVGVDPNPKLESCFWIDPLWLDQVGAAQINNLFDLTNLDPMQETEFGGGTLPQNPIFQPTFIDLLRQDQPFLASGDPNRITAAVTERLFRSGNDLQFATETAQDGSEIDDFAAPQPYLDQADLDGVPGTPVENARRQFIGDITWSAVAVARRPAGGVNLNLAATIGRIEGFDFYILAYKDRSFEDPNNYVMGLPGFPADRDPRMVCNVVDVTAVPPTDPPPTPGEVFGTGILVLEGNIDHIRSNDWMMLINFVGTVPQVGFYRVIGSAPGSNTISIDGSYFNIEDADATTFAIHLPNVVNVYKRQLEIEFSESF